jgi:hypothetical protein
LFVISAADRGVVNSAEGGFADGVGAAPRRCAFDPEGISPARRNPRTSDLSARLMEVIIG